MHHYSERQYLLFQSWFTAKQRLPMRILGCAICTNMNWDHQSNIICNPAKDFEMEENKICINLLCCCWIALALPIEICSRIMCAVLQCWGLTSLLSQLRNLPWTDTSIMILGIAYTNAEKSYFRYIHYIQPKRILTLPQHREECQMEVVVHLWFLGS